ncbi:anthrone oxygenase family protein [Actinokineospora enzanensis]|uniref:anthrone oxygenase family protein n=1 Tax=Actinokineospora enzanensis TaxID=155975 RepID=UPI000363B2EF|nr:anthrone oxygenase family protein [Actinokineospora enzanensis]
MAGLLPTLALAMSAVVAGVMLGAALASEPLLVTMAPRDYVLAKQFAGPRLEPLMPILTCLSWLCELGAAVAVPERARVPVVVAVLATAAVLAVSATRTAPINRWVAGLDADHLPADWAAVDPRARWRRWHLVRTGLICGAVVADAVAVCLVLA